MFIFANKPFITHVSQENMNESLLKLIAIQQIPPETSLLPLNQWTCHFDMHQYKVALISRDITTEMTNPPFVPQILVRFQKTGNVMRGESSTFIIIWHNKTINLIRKYIAYNQNKVSFNENHRENEEEERCLSNLLQIWF